MWLTQYQRQRFQAELWKRLVIVCLVTWPKQFQNGWKFPLRNYGGLLYNRSAGKMESVVPATKFYVETGDPGNVD